MKMTGRNEMMRPKTLPKPLLPFTTTSTPDGPVFAPPAVRISTMLAPFSLWDVYVSPSLVVTVSLSPDTSIRSSVPARA